MTIDATFLLNLARARRAQAHGLHREVKILQDGAAFLRGRTVAETVLTLEDWRHLLDLLTTDEEINADFLADEAATDRDEFVVRQLRTQRLLGIVRSILDSPDAGHQESGSSDVQEDGNPSVQESGNPDVETETPDPPQDELPAGVDRGPVPVRVKKQVEDPEPGPLHARKEELPPVLREPGPDTLAYEVLEFVRRAPEPCRPTEVARALNANVGSVNTFLHAMVLDGLLERCGRGLYRAA